MLQFGEFREYRNLHFLKDISIQHFSLIQILIHSHRHLGSFWVHWGEEKKEVTNGTFPVLSKAQQNLINRF